VEGISLAVPEIGAIEAAIFPRGFQSGVVVIEAGQQSPVFEPSAAGGVLLVAIEERGLNALPHAGEFHAKRDVETVDVHGCVPQAGQGLRHQ
jgi:hypothetical protein